MQRSGHLSGKGLEEFLLSQLPLIESFLLAQDSFPRYPTRNTKKFRRFKALAEGNPHVLGSGKNGIVFRGPHDKAYKVQTENSFWRKPFHEGMNLLLEETSHSLNPDETFLFVPIDARHVLSINDRVFFIERMPTIKGFPICPINTPGFDTIALAKVPGHINAMGVLYDFRGADNFIMQTAKAGHPTIVLETFGICNFDSFFQQLDRVQSPVKQEAILEKIARYYLLLPANIVQDGWVQHRMPLVRPEDSKHPLAKPFARKVLELNSQWHGKNSEAKKRRVISSFRPTPSSQMIEALQRLK